MSAAENTPIFSEKRKCEHCGNQAPMREMASFNDVEQFVDDGVPAYEEGAMYQLLQCPACKHVVLRMSEYFNARGAEYGPWHVLYPSNDDSPHGMPPAIAKALEAARRVRVVDANAYGVLIGRLLDMVCADRDAQGGTLAERLDDLAQKGEIPDRLAKVASGLRRLRNIGAHADLGELTEADVPLLDDLSIAVLEYVYSAPALVEQVEARVRALKKADNEPQHRLE